MVDSIVSSSHLNSISLSCFICAAKVPQTRTIMTNYILVCKDQWPTIIALASTHCIHLSIQHIRQIKNFYCAGCENYMLVRWRVERSLWGLYLVISIFMSSDMLLYILFSLAQNHFWRNKNAYIPGFSERHFYKSRAV